MRYVSCGSYAMILWEKDNVRKQDRFNSENKHSHQKQEYGPTNGCGISDAGGHGPEGLKLSA